MLNVLNSAKHRHCLQGYFTMNVGYIALVWYKQCGKIQEVIFMHRVNEKQLLSSNNGMNIYPGCTHGCIYCSTQSRCRRHLHIIIYTQSVFKRDSIFQLYMLQIRKQQKERLLRRSFCIIQILIMLL